MFRENDLSKSHASADAGSDLSGPVGHALARKVSMLAMLRNQFRTSEASHSSLVVSFENTRDSEDEWVLIHAQPSETAYVTFKSDVGLEMTDSVGIGLSDMPSRELVLAPWYWCHSPPNPREITSLRSIIFLGATTSLITISL